VWWCIPVIPALVRQRQEDPEFKASLDYIQMDNTTKKCRGKADQSNRRA
jgi:hypothetical protein